jgi:hypothetical protein
MRSVCYFLWTPTGQKRNTGLPSSVPNGLTRAAGRSYPLAAEKLAITSLTLKRHYIYGFFSGSQRNELPHTVKTPLNPHAPAKSAQTI